MGAVLKILIQSQIKYKNMVSDHLLKKYNREVSRYTSYPTIPFWEGWTGTDEYLNIFKTNFNKYNSKYGISLYLHLPFCESLCSFCACNKIITTNHGVEEDYLNAIISEWYLYRKLMGTTPVIRELHLGGGTPTFFSPDNLRRLLNCIFDLAEIHPEKEFSIEGHPNNTTKAHLEMLYQFGFTRLSLGVQDHDPKVQRIINRIQPFENVKRVTEIARQTGFTSVNYDLIYGLPLQTIESVQKTMEDTIALSPDRIAYYSYAHVPWKSKAQRLYDANDLPSAEQKLKFYQLSRSLFLTAGYKDIGMDHFSLPGERLYKAFQEGSLHRNFMGYTTAHTPFMVGLGLSAISDTGSAYAQNDKKLTNYYRDLRQSKLPIIRGYMLSDTDIAFREYIMAIACKGSVTLKPEHATLLNVLVMPELREMADDGLIELDQSQLKVTALGRLFLRNICQAFDVRLKQDHAHKENLHFSSSV